MIQETTVNINITVLYIILIHDIVEYIPTYDQIVRNSGAVVAIVIQEINELVFKKESNRMPLLSGNTFHRVQSEKPWQNNESSFSETK